jgi:hypothetical protein
MNAQQTEQFEQFWRTYPRRIGKGAARKAFEKALKLATFEEIMTGITRQLPYYSSREQQFIPHPTTWLNQERWADEPQPVQQRRQGDMVSYIDNTFTGNGYGFSTVADAGFERATHALDNPSSSRRN